MSSSKRIFVIGGRSTRFIGKGNPNFIWKKHADFGKKENPFLEDYITNSVQGALEETGTAASAIERAYIGNFAAELFCKQAHLGAALIGANPAFRYLPSTRVEGACASGGLAFAQAVQSIHAGAADVVLVAGAEVQNTVTAREGGDFLATAAHYRNQRKLDDFTFPCLFARRMKGYRAHYRGVTEQDIAHVSVKAYANANRNPLAHMHAVKMPLDVASTYSDDRNPRFLKNEEFKDFLKVSDCSQVSDGGSALIVVSEKGLAKLGKKLEQAIEVLTVQQSTDNLYDDGSLIQLENTTNCVQRAYVATKLTPKDVQVAEVHDCFSIAEVQMMEALGFAAPGKGAYMAKDGVSHITGKLPVNTGGGLIAFGHPVGATGVKQVVEIWRQMKGKSGSYQMKNIPSIGLTANMGGNDKTTVISVLKNL